MARGRMDVAARLERQEKKILKMTEELEQAKEEYKNFRKKKRKKEDINKSQMPISGVKDRWKKC